jgi:hypothetical protein
VVENVFHVNPLLGKVDGRYHADLIATYQTTRMSLISLVMTFSVGASLLAIRRPGDIC